MNTPPCNFDFCCNNVFLHIAQVNTWPSSKLRHYFDILRFDNCNQMKCWQFILGWKPSCKNALRTHTTLVWVNYIVHLKFTINFSSYEFLNCLSRKYEHVSMMLWNRVRIVIVSVATIASLEKYCHLLVLFRGRHLRYVVIGCALYLVINFRWTKPLYAS